jgi:hypothetical protein
VRVYDQILHLYPDVRRILVISRRTRSLISRVTVACGGVRVYDPILQLYMHSKKKGTCDIPVCNLCRLSVE